jgi:plastocyanin
MNKAAVYIGTAILGLSLILAACNNPGKAPTETGGEFGGIPVVIGLNGNNYSPAEKTIKAGSSVTFPVSIVHPLRGVGAANPISSTEAITDSNKATIKFDAPGTYEFFCTNHGVGSGLMKGTITVTN